jgi:hypothetical protein
VQEVKDGRRLRVRITFDLMARLGDKSEGEVVDAITRPGAACSAATRTSR